MVPFTNNMGLYGIYFKHTNGILDGEYSLIINTLLIE